MKFNALSIVHPGGQKIARGEKIIAVRSWTPPESFRGDLLIVENKKFLRNEGDTDPEGIPVALVKIRKIRAYEKEDIPAACVTRWDAGYYSWELVEVRPLNITTQVLAARGIYEVELDL